MSLLHLLLLEKMKQYEAFLLSGGAQISDFGNKYPNEIAQEYFNKGWHAAKVDCHDDTKKTVLLVVKP